MKKFLSIAAILVMSWTSAEAQILWKISGNGLKSPSYILGTHHIAPLSVLDDIKGFDKAFLAVDGVCGELIMADMQKPETMMEMQKSMMLPVGQTLHEFYTPEEYGRISTCFKNQIGMDLSMFDGMKPVVVMQQLVLVMTMKNIEGYNPNEQLDSHLQEKASQAGKKVSALETVQQQVDILFNTPTEEQAEDLLYVVDHEEESMEDAKELAEAYMKQDLDSLLESMETEEDEKGKDDMEKLVYERNADWLEQMPAMMQKGPVMFVVGAGHLPGEKGVLNGLRGLGYRVKAVK